MKKFFQKTAIAAALALPILASASVVTFDIDGAGGQAPVLIDALDWMPGNALAVGGNPAGGLAVDDTTKLLFQANLALGSLGDDAVVFPGAGSFITAVAGFNEIVTSATPLGATFGLNDPGVVKTADNFFYVYATSANGNNLTGTGFVAGTLIMSGYISSVLSSNFLLGINPATGLPYPLAPLDQSVNNDYPGTTTITGSGSTQLNVVVDFAHDDYFGSMPDGTTFSFFNTSQITPFTTVNPSACFSLNGTTGCNQLSNIGTQNGVPEAADGNTFNFQMLADANQSFITAVPEPGSLALVGLALGVVGFVGRRSSKKA